MKTNGMKLLRNSSKKFLLLISLFFLTNLLSAQNPISIENQLTGNPKSEWDISGSDDASIQGFATQISVNTGETIDFKIDVKAPATNYSIKIYRLGYYNGLGARLISDLGSFSGVAQDAPLYDAVTGKTDCSNWSVSTSWNTGSFTSGLYLAKITRADTQGSSHIAFVVRNDNGGATMLYKTSDTTWQAYNVYGGNSLYVDNNGIPNFNHATKVSYNRPFNTRGGGGGGGASEDWFFNSEYPMIRWLERNGYDVSYTTSVDMDKDPKQITPNGANNTYAHKVLMSVGHDEYWSIAERAMFENARDAGVHLAFFSGNEVYWKIRWEDDHRTLVCYKEGLSGENVCGGKCDPEETVWTGLWRDGCDFPLADGCNPENSLSGQISWGDATGSIEVPSTYKNLRFWRNTNIASLTDGNSFTLPYGTLGYEFDSEQYPNSMPKGRITMSNTTLGDKNHKLSLYKDASGAWVFGAGTIQWSWGLDEIHDRGNEAPSQDMQQATVNLLTDMGVSPTTLQSGLTITNPSNTNPPLSVIISPLADTEVPSGSVVVINGTASDTDGVVAGVEVSIDGGTTWNAANGTTTWSFAWTPSAEGSVTIKSRAFDDNGNMEISGTGINITVGEPLPFVYPYSIFNETDTPQSLGDNDGQAIEVGMKFRAAVNGYITGIRFYKATGDTGTHIGSLWSATGDLLASVEFNGESVSGWQQSNFSGPVAINANTTYVISYHSSDNFYTSTVGGLTSAVTTGNLTALANGTDGNNGVYIYSPSSAFPTETYQSSNYWVDVVFDIDAADDTAPTITHVIPENAAALVSSSANVSATFSESINEATLASKFELRDAANSLVPATVSYTNGTKTVTLIPINPLSYSTLYTAKLLSGIEDVTGNALATDYTWTFTTAPEVEPTPIPAPDGPGGPILIISSSNNPFSRYPIEILRAEGINQFKALDISEVNETVLANYEVAILGEVNINSAQVSLLTDWVNTGKTLIAMKPDAALYPLLGIASTSGTLSDKYLLFDTANGPGVGLVDETIQYHSAADLYTLSTTDTPTILATLYSDATTATTNPAVITRNVGAGKVVAFAYDLAKSVVYTRQGNPNWAGQQRDDQNDGNIRSNDLFTGTGGESDWIDFNKIQIPQADEQQHLLSNIIMQSIQSKMPLPKFWFLPRKLKAAVVMTGDDHGNNGTAGRFDYYLSFGNNTAEDVLNWRAIRGTSYIYESTPLSNTAAANYEAQGFEIGLHVNSGCNVYTYSSLQNSFTTQFSAFNGKYTSLSAVKTNRTHCISWSDWASKPKVETANGIHLNTDYYYWPASWVQDRPGLFTGSGMPMRFADLDGTLLNDYQVTTQMPDESGLNVANFINTLIDNAKGPKGYYGVFCANMHTDSNNSDNPSVIGSNAIVASAIANEIPVISAKQMLTWLDGRNASTYTNISFADNTLAFEITKASGAYDLQGMIPVTSSNGELISLLRSGSPVSYTTEIIKGINYAFFDAISGTYSAAYGVDTTPPIISNIIATPNGDGTATITWTTDEPATSEIKYDTLANNLILNKAIGTLTTNHSITINGLAQNTTYYFSVTSADAMSNSVTLPETPDTLQFTTPSGPCVADTTDTDFSFGQTTNTMIVKTAGGGLSLGTLIDEQFSGSGLPSNWGSFAWTGGSSTVNGGSVTVNGARLNTVAPTQTFLPGSIMEFEATFGAATFQHIGFGGGGDSTDSNGVYTGQNAWAMFSTGNQSSVLRARTSLNGSSSIDVDLPGSLIGSPHLYRIEWETNEINYYVDGVLLHTQPISISVAMRPAISDYNNDGISISVDWIKVSPYILSGTYVSQIFNTGTLKSWQEATFNDSIPTGTTLAISQRQANTLEAIDNTSWIPIPASGSVIGGVSQYIQYKVDLATTNSNVTPVLLDISFACSDPEQNAPLISTQPLLQTVCLGSEVSFTSAATGNPTPTAQWQVSEGNSNVWADIQTATTSSYTFTPILTDNNTKYRVIWTNNEGMVTSDEVLLNVNPLPTATISAIKNPICPGEAVQLQLTNANGSGPYTIVVNGQTYTNVAVNQPFATISNTEQSIWGNTGTPSYPDVNDGQSIEIGTKFRSTQSGYITGVRFYKGISNTGTHTAHLWTVGGTLLATATFTAETASGWQEVRFNTPINITANTTYIASYFSQSGGFAISPGFFTNNGITNSPLTALQSGQDGVNGVYKYGGGFPDGGNTANYWVDVLFSGANPDAIYNLTSIADTLCSNTADETPLSTVTILTAPLPDGTLLPTEIDVCDGDPVNLVFNATAGTGPFDLVINGTTYPNVSSGMPFVTTTATNTAIPTTIWPNTTTGGSQVVDSNPTELGHRFTASVDGSISGIRFYKTGFEVISGFTGSLWSIGNTATPLATATYIGDNTPGWKEIIFGTPVSITAVTQYMVSYFSPNTNFYAFTSNGLNTPITNGLLTIEASFYKQPGQGYPLNNSTANYWVDVVFTPTASMNFNLTSITNVTGCTKTVDVNATVTVNSSTTIGNVTTTICAGETYVWPANGQSYTTEQSGTTFRSGCNTATLNLSITPQLLWYLDADGDHYYTGEAVVQCASPGVGYTTSGLSGGGDCADDNAAINPGATEICYNNIDDNCNGTLSEGCAPVVVNMTPSYHNTTLSSLAIAVPAVPYYYAPYTNLKYRFSITNVTTGVTAPDIIQSSRFVNIPQALHAYNATYTIKASAVINDEVVPYAGNTITIFSPVVQLITLSSVSCGATLASLSSTLSANAGLNATGYTFRIRLTSDNGPTPTYGTSSSATRFVSANSFASFPLSYGTSYQVAVQYTFTDPVTSLPVESGYGAECTVITPSIPKINLASPTCGGQVSSLGANISSAVGAYATSYQFRIRLTSDNGPTPTYYTTLPNASRFSSLSAFQGITFAYNTNYSISVQYSIVNNSTTVWSGYGSECIVKTPFFPTTQLVQSQCGQEGATSLTQQLNIIPYPGFPSYKVRLEESNGEHTGVSQELVFPYSYFRLNQFSIVQPGMTYYVSVAIKQGGVFGNFSTECDIHTAAPTKSNTVVVFKATAYPNPFANNFMIDVKTMSQSIVNLKVYDMVGRLLEQRDVRVSDLETTTIGDRYPSGVYNVVVSQEDSVETVRVVKR